MIFFPELIGNEKTKNRIGSSISRGKVPHAFLIDGDRGSGKMTLALGIAAALACEGGSTLPCMECNSCRRIKKLSHPDVRVLERNGDRATIGVAEVKELRSDMFFSPTEASHKVYIIREADKLTPEAQNALLIVLEEPPPSVVIILLAEGTDKILTTVKSRAQYIAMARFGKEELSRHLTDISEVARRLSVSSPEKYEAVITESGGVIGAALDLLDPERSRELEERRADILAVISALSPSGGYRELQAALSALPTKRPELLSMLEELMSALSDIVKQRRTGASELTFFGNKAAAENALLGTSEGDILKIYDQVTSAHESITRNAGIAATLAALAGKIKMI